MQVDHLRIRPHTLQELDLPMEGPALTCEDNQSAMETINTNKPTGQSGHTDIRFFAIQGWKEDALITMKHTPGIINRADVVDHVKETQPPMTNFFPETIDENCVADFQGGIFDPEGLAHSSHGLLLESSHIMGFFCNIARKGHKMEVDKLSVSAVCIMTKTSNVMIKPQHGVDIPCQDENNREQLPRHIAATLAAKLDIHMTPSSLFSGFFNAFHHMMTHHLDDKERN